MTEKADCVVSFEVGNIISLFLFYVDLDHVPQKVFPSFSTTMAGGLLLLLLDNNFITLFIVAGMLLAVVACLRLNK